MLLTVWCCNKSLLLGVKVCEKFAGRVGSVEVFELFFFVGGALFFDFWSIVFAKTLLV